MCKCSCPQSGTELSLSHRLCFYCCGEANRPVITKFWFGLIIWINCLHVCFLIIICRHVPRPENDLMSKKIMAEEITLNCPINEGYADSW